MPAQDSIKYGTRKKECYRIYDNSLGFVDRTNEHVENLISKWNEIENFEFSKRKNGKVLSKMILMFPNEWSQMQKEELIKSFFETKFSDNHHFTFCFHGGKDGEVALNSHGHLYFSERMINDPKNRKDPAMSKMGYIDRFAKEWQKACGIDLTKNPKVKRIPMMQWKKNPEKSRQIKEKQKLKLLELERHVEIAEKKILFLEKLISRVKSSIKKRHSFRLVNSIPDRNTILNLINTNKHFVDLKRKRDLEVAKKLEFEQINELLTAIQEHLLYGNFEYDFTLTKNENIDYCIFKVRQNLKISLNENFEWRKIPKLADILNDIIEEYKGNQNINQFTR